MMCLLLATVLNLSPGISLADNVESRHVALSDIRTRLQFVSDDDDKRPSLDAMTREQLAVELRRLDGTRPSLVGPIVLLSLGAAFAIPGAVLMVTSLAAIAVNGTPNFGSSGTSGLSAAIPYFTFIGGAVLATVGVILVLIGGIKLPFRLKARSAHSREVDDVKKQIDVVDKAPVAPPVVVPPADAIPPPPPPPPQANLIVPGQLQTLWAF